MLTLLDVSLEFSGRWLYRNATWQLTNGDRIGLIGKNGTGKSTLLRIMVGDQPPTEGSVQRNKGLKIGFLNQDLLGWESGDSVYDVAVLAFKPLLELEKAIDIQAESLAEDCSDEAIQKLADMQTEFQLAGGYEIEARTHKVLSGLGFSTYDITQPFDTFSGGWRMRALLAQILLSEPHLLLLDEPTNHLDLPSIQWLETYLKDYPGAVVVVSHDRFFLNRISQKIVEVAYQRLNFYAGNYDSYLEQKEERMLLHASAYENQQKQIAQSERFIERFRAKASKASQAQSRIKLLDKMDRIEAPETDEAGPSFSFRNAKPSGVTVLNLDHIGKAYGIKKVLENTSAEIRRGDKIGLVGPNGIGKSTLLKVIAGLEPHEGSRNVGYNVQQALFAQSQLEALHLDWTIWEEMQPYVVQTNDTYVRTVLGCFLFSGDDIDKRIRMLSGGEKARLSLAKTLLDGANFLLLDEPTNHLDLQSIHTLMEALAKFDGTYVVVSHDRWFLSKVTNQIWYIEDRQLKTYPGNFAEWDDWYTKRQAQLNAAQKQAASAPKPVATKTTAAAPLAPKPDKQREASRQQAEKQIEQLEKEIKSLKSKLQQPELAQDFAQLADIQAKIDSLEAQQLERMSEWEALAG